MNQLQVAANFPRMILHIEDNPIDAELVGGIIGAEWPDCQIEVVDSAEQLRGALTSRSYDVFISDYSMPGFDGLSALQIVRESFPEVPFIFLSGTIGEEFAVEALKRGANDYLLKDRTARLIPAIVQTLERCEERRMRRETEVSLRESNQRFEELAEQSSEVFWSMSVDPEQLQYVSPAVERIFQRPMEAFAALNRLWGNSIHPADRRRVERAFTDCLSGDAEKFAEEYRILRPSGEIRWLFDTGTPIRSEDGGFHRISGVTLDITDRKIAEGRVNELANLINCAQDAIIATDRDGTIFFWNAGADRMFGWNCSEAMGNSFQDLFDEESFANIDEVRKSLTRDQWKGEIAIHDRRGRKLTLECSLNRIRDGFGHPKAQFFICSNITEKRNLETQIRRAQRMESLGTMASGIAHDLNNVLSPVLMMVQYLRFKTVDQDVIESLKSVETSVRHGASLVRQILAFARGGSNERVVVGPRIAMREFLSMLKDTLPATVSFMEDISPDLHPVRTNPTELCQVMMNLVVNARHAMPKGGKITLQVRNCEVSPLQATAYPGAQPGSHVVFRVADTGIGIAEENIERIFDPFFTTKPMGEGSGLGLSTSLGIVRGQGGFMQVLSEVGKGSEFSVYLPAFKSEDISDVANDFRIAEKPGNGECVLVVDDEQSVRKLTGALLETAGYRPLLARNGSDAVQLLRRESGRASVALIDLLMPGVSGTELAMQLREIAPSLPVLFVSGISEGRAGFDVKKMENSKFLQKPIQGSDLIRAVQTAVEGCSRGAKN